MSAESGAVREWGPEFDDVIGVVRSRALSIEDAWAVLAAARPLIEAQALREAAEDRERANEHGEPYARLHDARWLRDRADRLEREADQ